MTEVQNDLVEVRVVEKEEVEVDHDPQYEPIISLPEVNVPTQEEDEMELIKLRAKLFRLDTTEQPPEWKERGTGDVKLLRHGTKNTVRVVMRRDKTLKICANHFVTPHMELKPNCSSDRAWVWSVLADFADEKARSELLAIKFANAENAKKWKEMFEEAKHIVETQCGLYTKSEDECLCAHDGYESAASSGSGSEFEDVAETLDQLKLTTNEEAQETNKPDETTTSPTKANPSEPACASS